MPLDNIGQQFVQNLFRPTQTVLAQRQIPSTVELGSLERTLYRTVGRPVIMLKMDTLLLNQATDGNRLAQVQVPDGVYWELTDIDTVYTSTGSYRIQILDASGTSAYDLLENSATDIHWSGHQLLDSGSIIRIAQGATVSGTGNIDGRLSGREYLK